MAYVLLVHGMEPLFRSLFDHLLTALINKLPELVSLEISAWHALFYVSETFQDFLSFLILVVVLDDFNVQFTPLQLHVSLDLLFKKLLL